MARKTTAPASGDKPRRFEYVTWRHNGNFAHPVIGDRLREELEAFGSEGWEAVCSLDGYMVLFKREVMP